MPYSGELANKSTHGAVASDDGLHAELSACQVITQPSASVTQQISSKFLLSPIAASALPPLDTVTVDASSHFTVIDNQPPPTKMGTVKIGTSRLYKSEYEGFRQAPLIDPFILARVEEHYESTWFQLAGANVKFGGLATSMESFRYSVNEALVKTSSAGRSLMDTLFHLANMRKGMLGSQNSASLLVDECPECGNGPIQVHKQNRQTLCPRCSCAVYPADVLRLWKEENDDDFITSCNRVMSVFEHLLLVNNILEMQTSEPERLGKSAFIVDGPLAVFGLWSQWIHKPIMEFLYHVDLTCRSNGMAAPLVLGLTKTGDLVDHANYISRFIPKKGILAVNDDYRAQYVGSRISKIGHGFGSSTYYGQDFIYNSGEGDVYVFGLPYPFLSKESSPNFQNEKVQLNRYHQLGNAIALIDYYRSDQYKNAIVPIMLAHKFTAISAVPGGMMIDAMVGAALGLTN